MQRAFACCSLRSTTSTGSCHCACCASHGIPAAGDQVQAVPLCTWTRNDLLAPPWCHRCCGCSPSPCSPSDVGCWRPGQIDGLPKRKDSVTGKRRPVFQAGQAKLKIILLSFKKATVVCTTGCTWPGSGLSSSSACLEWKIKNLAVEAPGSSSGGCGDHIRICP